MSQMVNVDRLRDIAELEFGDIVAFAFSPDVNELRIILTDNSFVDLWFSLKLPDRYSYHWERRAVDGTVYRHDNAPHRRWLTIATFPHHFHNGREDYVVESHLSQDPYQALREFLTFVRGVLKKV